MKKLALAALAALALNLAHAAELEGFKFDDQIKLGNAELVVNGTGVRSKFGKRYAMALYLPAKTADAKAALKDRIKQLADTVVALGEIKAGTAIVFDWVPERGMVLTVGGKPAGQPIPGENFYTALLRVWLGEDPAQGNLKEALLGKPQ